jgi:hypothetical protein
MQIRFPFLYNALYRADERHIGEHGGIRGNWAEVDVAEYSEGETTLACQVEGFGPSGVPYLVEVRKIGSGYFRPKLSVEDNPYTPLDDGCDRLTALELGTVVPLAQSQFLRPAAGTGPNASRVADRYSEIIAVIEGQPDTRDVINDNMNEAIAAHVRAAANLVIVDGMVWERCQMPRLVVDMDCRRPKVAVAVPLWHHAPPPNQQSFPLGMAHRITQLLEDAAADGEYLDSRAVGGVRPDWKVEDIALPNVTLCDPSMSVLPRREAVDVASEAFKSYPSTDFARYSRDYIYAWVEMRDALVAAKADTNPESARRVMEAWKTTSAEASAEAARHGARGHAVSRLLGRHSLGLWTEIMDLHEQSARFTAGQTPQRHGIAP